MRKDYYTQQKIKILQSKHTLCENFLKKEYNKPHIDCLKVVDIKKEKLRIKDTLNRLKKQ
tara:strand:+ start:644 stop:823 length:180 start_codon:yes stop_codon:yes gene_type:complete